MAIVFGVASEVRGDGYVWVAGRAESVSASVQAEHHPNAGTSSGEPTLRPSHGWPDDKPPPEVLSG